MELTVAARGAHQEPAVGFDEPDQVAYLHPSFIARRDPSGDNYLDFTLSAKR